MVRTSMGRVAHASRLEAEMQRRTNRVVERRLHGSGELVVTCVRALLQLLVAYLIVAFALAKQYAVIFITAARPLAEFVPVRRAVVGVVAYHPVLCALVKARDWALSQHRERVQGLLGRTCVEISTDMDMSRSLDMATRVMRNVCDFLQVALAALFPLQQANPVRWSDQIATTSRVVFGVMEGADQGTTAQAQVVGMPAPTLSAESFQRLDDYGLFVLSNGLSTTRETEYQEILQSSVRWFAKGEREEFLLDARLSYVTAVDLFFSRGDGSSSTHRFCKGFAFALQDQPSEIVRVARFARHIYASRSELSHPGDQCGG
jgi:hypothetical protein